MRLSWAVSPALELRYEPFGVMIPYKVCLGDAFEYVGIVCGKLAEIGMGALVGCAIGEGGIEGLFGPGIGAVVPGANSPGNDPSSSSSDPSVRSTTPSRQSLRMLEARPEYVKFEGVA